MKIEQLIVQYLYQHKTVTIQNMGTFHLSKDIIPPAENEKESLLPDNAIVFEYNSKAGQDDNLVDYIVQQTKKIKPLATSDLESFSILTRQFINIGKPHVIEGLGTIQKNQLGHYEFHQGHTVAHAPKPDSALADLKEKDKEVIDFSSPVRRQAGNKWLLPVLLIFVVLGALAFFYFRYNENKKEKAENILTNTVKPDTTVTKKDSVIVPTAKVTAATPSPIVQPDTGNAAFRIIIKEYPSKDAAQKVYNKFTAYGHKLLIYSKDSILYKVAMPFNRPLSDTAKLRDSLRIYYGGKPFVEIN